MISLCNDLHTFSEKRKKFFLKVHETSEKLPLPGVGYFWFVLVFLYFWFVLVFYYSASIGYSKTDAYMISGISRHIYVRLNIMLINIAISNVISAKISADFISIG